MYLLFVYSKITYINSKCITELYVYLSLFQSYQSFNWIGSRVNMKKTHTPFSWILDEKIVFNNLYQEYNM